MNRIFFFVALLSTAFLTNCKKDKSPEELILGKWNATSLFADGENLIEGDSTYKIKAEFEFTSAGTMILSLTESDLSVTPVESETYALAGTYTISGDQLTISLSDGVDSYVSTGPFDITSSKLSFTGTNAGAADFIQSFEAEKL